MYAITFFHAGIKVELYVSKRGPWYQAAGIKVEPC